MQERSFLSKCFDFLFSWGLLLLLIGVIMAAAMPDLRNTGMNPNEVSAVATLGSIISAEELFRGKSYIDVDRDGIGEYGYLAELAGQVPLRAPADTENPGRAPAVLWKALGTVNNHGFMKRSGYYFALYIADHRSLPCREAKGGGCNEVSLRQWEKTDGGINPSEKLWCCYAWPVRRGETGMRAFQCTQSGIILYTDNEFQQYSGLDLVPCGLAAYESFGRGNLTDALSIDGIPSRASDGGTWSVCD